MLIRSFFFFLLILANQPVCGQKLFVSGNVSDEIGNPIKSVDILIDGLPVTTTNSQGNYQFTTQRKQSIQLLFKHISHKEQIKNVDLLEDQTALILDITLQKKTEQLQEVVVKHEKINADGSIKINPSSAQKLPSPTMGVEGMLMTLPGVNNNNELSSQYNVRGGNFDENLLYINGIEVYRPFLIRAGQQEGLSIVNSAMVQNIKFSAGGFEAKYGDRLSSVLDITYRTPEEFKLTTDASFLGGSLTTEGISSNKKLKAIASARFRNNSLFINSKETETNANPTFWDVQALLSYQANQKLTIDFLGNLSINNYQNTPKRRRVQFGTIEDPIDLIVNFQGEENNDYQTIFGALSAKYRLAKDFELKLTGSVYDTAEQEQMNVLASYNLDEANQASDTTNRIGAQLNFSDNQLDASISNLQLRGEWKLKNHQFLFGLKHQQEKYTDQLNEVEQIDTSGNGLNPDFTKNDSSAIVNSVNTSNEVTVLRNQFFVQYSKRFKIKKQKIAYHIGGRMHRWSIATNNLTSVENSIYSLRSQLAIKPNWDKDILFRLKAGLYSQPPNYREMRANNGAVVPTVDAQNSFQVLLGSEYTFKKWERPFKLTSEAYYKYLTNVNTYTIDNVRIRYDASNNAMAYAYGLDFRLNGEFVAGIDSWLSLGFLRTQEQRDQGEFMDRPTDQRFKFAMMFQDYMPKFPNVKMYLNLVYNSGLPGGSPSYVNAQDYPNRLNDYRRADIGVLYEIVGPSNSKNNYWQRYFSQLELGVQLFNLFDVQNAITNTWVRDAFSGNFYAVPNYMTGRVFNIKLHAQL